MEPISATYSGGYSAASTRTTAASRAKARRASATPKPTADPSNGRQIGSFENGTTLVIERNGELICSCGTYIKTKWCNHLQHVVTTSLDAKPNASPAADFTLIPERIIVPVFPTKNFYQDMTVHRVEDDGSRMVTFKCDGFDPASKPITLGWIFPGECRNVIRNMLLEWLRGMFLEVPNCCSTIHKNVQWSRAETRKNEDMERRDLADLWSLLNTNECYACHSFSNFNDDAPEL